MCQIRGQDQRNVNDLFIFKIKKKDLSQPCYKESIFSDKNKIEGLPSNFFSLTFFFPALKQ